MLNEWMVKSGSCEVTELRGFARGLRRDESAVMAGLSEKWSNGPVEAAVNSLKTIKRQMYGRGKLDLLRKRYLTLAARRDCKRQPDKQLVTIESGGGVIHLKCQSSAQSGVCKVQINKICGRATLVRST